MDFKPLQQNRWLIVLGVIGVFCLLFGTVWNGQGRAQSTMAPVSQTTAGNANASGMQNTSGATGGNASVISYENFLDAQLTSMLKRIAGIHAVSVMVVLDSTEQLEVAMDQRTTTQTQQSNGQATSTAQTTDRQVFTEHTADGAEVPFVIRRDTPTVRGVFVTVSADDFYVAKDQILDAVGHVLDVPAYKISVEPQQNNG